MPFSQQLVFIIGHQRSGTTLLNHLLTRHSDLAQLKKDGKPTEGEQVQDVYTPIIDLEDWNPGNFSLNPEMRWDERVPLTYGRRLHESWSRHWDLRKSVLVEKTPCNILKVKGLNKLFPSAKFVWIVRHPIPVGYAIAKWTTADFQGRMEHLARCFLIAENDFKDIDPALHRTVRYEDFVRNPNEVLKELYRFIGVSLRTKSDTREKVSGVVNKKYLWYYKTDELAQRYLSGDGKRLETIFSPYGYSFVEKFVDAHPWSGLLR